MVQLSHLTLKMKSMVWKVSHKLKVPEIETGGDGAAHQRISTEAPGTLPSFAGNDCLKFLPGIKIISQNTFLQKTGIRLVGYQLQRRAL
jgi:hypothetical protein